MSRKHLKSVATRMAAANRMYRSRVGAELAHMGIHAGQEGVLMALREADGQSMTGLAAALGVQPPTVTKMVGRLSASGYVERRASESDGRQAQVFLTRQGTRAMAEIDGVLGNVEDEALAGIDGKDQKKLLRLLRRIAKNLGEGGEPDGDDGDA